MLKDTVSSKKKERKKKKDFLLQLNTKLSNEFINLKTALNIHSKSIGNKLNITHWLII